MNLFQRLVIAFWLLAFATLAGAVPPKVPAAPVLVTVGGRPVQVTIDVPTTEFAAAAAFSPEACLWFPGESSAGKKTYLVQAYQKGVYRVIFWTKGETEYSTLVIDAGGDPIPPGPGPGPGPQPTPPDAFTQSLIDAYRTDTTPDKARVVAFFASLYRLAAKNDANDQSLTKLGQLYQRLVAARKATYPDESVILPIRKLIEAELNATVQPVTDQPLDATTRTRVATAFNRIATALEALK